MHQRSFHSDGHSKKKKPTHYHEHGTTGLI
jgi:hypothetical protein